MLLSLIFACSILKNLSSDSENLEEKDPVEVDILIVMDNSASMWDEGAALGLHLEELLSESDDQSISYQIGITTSSVDYSGAGNSENIEPGEGGLFVGDIIRADDDSPIELLREQLFCETIYWDAVDLMDPDNQDPDYVCGDETENISVQYLDCLCGVNGWENPMGSGMEELLEAALLATCRSKSSVPQDCYDPNTVFFQEDLGSNDSLFRENAESLIIFIGDEGDSSRRVPFPETNVDVYTEAFAAFQKHSFTFVSLGPNYDESSNSISCNSGGASDAGVQRLINMSLYSANEGLYLPLGIEDDNGNCQLADFSAHMTEINALIYELD